MTRPTLVLADDHTIVVEGLRALLEPDFEILTTVPDGRRLVEAVEQRVPDAVVLDISMPLLNGIEAARRLKALAPDLKLVFLTMHSDAAHVREAFRVGASAYLLKRGASTELAQAIREALRGRWYLSPLVTQNVLELLIDATTPRARSARDAGLTPRQREVLQLLAEGRSIRAIASLLQISAKTVEFHKYRIMEELGVSSIAELTQYAIKHGIVTVDT